MQREKGASVARTMSRTISIWLRRPPSPRSPGARTVTATAIRVRRRWRPGQSCGTIRQELDPLDRKGTQAKVEAASAGKKLAPKDKGDVDRYNTLLNQYLGARCHA